MKIKKDDILNEVHKMVPKVNKNNTKEIIEAFYYVLKEHITQGDEVSIQGLGKFSHRVTTMKKAYDFVTGTVVEENRKAYRILFSASKQLKETLQANLAEQAEQDD